MIRIVKVNQLRTPEQRATVCYCGRNFAGWPASPWKNPYPVASFGDRALDQFIEFAKRQPAEWLDALWEACEHGAKPLGCWCVNAEHGDGQEVKCHAQVLAAMLAERFLGQSALFEDSEAEK